MSEHTKEPWKVFTSEDGEKLLGVGSAETAEGIADYRGGIWAWDDEEGIANARRIVACVNACHGIPTETLERDSVRVGVRAVVAEEALKEIRDVAAYCRADGRIGSEDLALIEKYVETGLKPETGREAQARADKAERLLEEVPAAIGWIVSDVPTPTETLEGMPAVANARALIKEIRAFLEEK